MTVMTEQVQGLEEGMRVQIKPEVLARMVTAWKQKMTGREGTVLNFVRHIGQTDIKSARVKWGKKGGRGKEFIEIFSLHQLQPVPTTQSTE